MNKRKLFQKNGITLIALVISIIVMLILAGVTLNAVIGDNGIITQAQTATYMQSVAMLEEFLQTEYTKLYMNNNENLSMLELIKTNHDEWFYKPERTGLNYILVDGHVYYLIDKENLPEQIKKQLKGGDANNKEYSDYANFKDVYGVRTDLKVYYCSNGLESIIGASDELLEDSFARTAISKDSTSGLGQFLIDSFDWIKTDADGNILSDGMSSVKDLIIDSSNVKSLSELYNFSSIRNLYLKNLNLENLSGIELCPKLENVYLYNSKAKDYEKLGEVTNLKKLSFEEYLQEEFEKCCVDISNANFEYLNSIAIVNSDDIATIEALDYFSNDSKSKVKEIGLKYINIKNLIGLENYINLENLDTSYLSNLIETKGLNSTNIKIAKFGHDSNLKSIIDLNKSTELVELNIESTKVNTLSCLENCYKIENIEARNAQLGLNVDSKLEDNKIIVLEKSNNNALYSLRNKNSLKKLTFSNNKYLVYVDYLQNSKNINNLFLEGNDYLKGDEVALLKEIILNCGNNYSIPSNLGLIMLDNNITKLDLKNQRVALNDFEALKIYKNIKYLNLKNLVLLDAEGNEISNEDYNLKINEVLSNLNNLEVIDLDGINALNQITFVNNINKLREICLRDTSVTTNENGLLLLNNTNPNIDTVVINNSKNDLTKIQPLISKCDLESEVTGSLDDVRSITYGFICENQDALNTLINCTEITNFVCASHFNYTVDLSNCSKIKKISFYGTNSSRIYLPSQGSYTMKFTDLYDNVISGGGGCRELTIIHPYTTSNENFWRLMEGFRNSNVLEKITFQFQSVDGGNCIDSTGLEVFSNCKKLRYISWTGRNVTPYKSSCRDISAISNMTSLEEIIFSNVMISSLPDLSRLTKLEKITICNSLLLDINSLVSCTSLKYLSLYNNSINDLSSIKNLENLEYLNLENNSISDAVTSIINGNVNNIEILNNLKNRYGRLKELYIAGNNLEDKSKLEWASSL